MAPKRMGLPKGAPLPRKTMDELMEEARIRAETNLGVTSKSKSSHVAAAASSRWQGLAGKSQGSPMPLAPSSANTGIVKALGKAATSTFTTRSQYRTRLMNERSKPQPISTVTVPPPSQLVPKRTDLPVVRNLTRGNKRKAIVVASDPVLLAPALEAYQRDFKSAGDTSAFNVKTWQDIHANVYWPFLHRPADEPWLPLDETKIMAIGAAMKEGGYRSTKNYMSAVKEKHIEAGFSWNDQLELAGHRFVLSTTRGMGPGRQSSPLPFMKIVGMSFGPEFEVTAYPVNPGAMLVITTFFLMRELEVAAAKYSDLKLDSTTKSITMHLSVSKNDPEAKGCDRTWNCTCEPEIKLPPERHCPYHAAEQHKKYLDQVFRDALRGIGEDDFPLFPSGDGSILDPAKVVEFIEAIAQTLGEYIYI